MTMGGKFCGACGEYIYIYLDRYYFGVDRQCTYIYMYRHG